MNADDLAKILDELGQRLGPTGERVFGLAVQYQVTSALTGLVIATICFLGLIAAAIVLARITVRRYRAEVRRYAEGKGPSYYRTEPDLAGYAMAWSLGGMAVLFVGGCLIVAIQTSLITLANPEYSALRGLIESIR